MSKTLDLLLKTDPEAISKLPEKDYVVKRLSNIAGEPVVFKLKALPYNRAYELTNDIVTDLHVHILLAGVVDPDFKDKMLLEKYGAPTPAELVKKLLLAGEIETISKTIEQLSGFRTNVLEEVKKK